MNGPRPASNRASFGEVVRRLRGERGLSMEELAYTTRSVDPNPHRRGLSFSYISLLERGYRRPNIEVMELVARALDVSPNLFDDYRLALVKRLFDEEQVGIETAIENLELLEQLVAQNKPAQAHRSSTVEAFEAALARD